MYLNANFVIVIITSFYISAMCYKRIDYGNACGEGDNLGVCKTIEECPSALSELMKSNYSFPKCDFLPNGSQIICCKDFKIAASTNYNHKIVENDGRVWEKITISSTSTNKPSPILLNKNRGQKSEAACKEYETKVAASITPLITAGVDATLGEFPHMAQIGYDSPDFGGATAWNCGGSLIHERFVLTAAHCVEKLDKNPPKVVRLGFVNSNLARNAQFVESEVFNYTVHPEFNRVLKLHDIALLELAKEVKIKTNVHPACLYQKNDDPIILTATGWGTTLQEENAQILQKVDIESVDLKQCNEAYKVKYNKTITTSQMCRLTPNEKADTCQGDSGGPLQTFRYEAKYIYDIVGVTSYGGGSCGDGITPGIYARVYSYIDWIESIVWP